MSTLNNQEYIEFLDEETAELWGAKHYPNTTKLSVDSIQYKDIIDYTAGDYININTVLRNPECNRGKYKKYLVNAKTMNSELCKHWLPENILVFRYTNLKNVKRCARRLFLKKGIVFSDDAFCSTTLVESALHRPAKINMYDCILKIYLPRGMSGIYISCDFEREEIGAECEFLLPQNTKLKIVNINKNICGMKWCIECEAILK